LKKIKNSSADSAAETMKSAAGTVKYKKIPKIIAYFTAETTNSVKSLLW